MISKYGIPRPCSSIKRIRELSFLWLTGGGCGRNEIKDSVKFFFPLGSSRKIIGPSSMFVKISYDPSYQKFVVLRMMSCRGYDIQKSLACQLGVWGAVSFPAGPSALEGSRGGAPRNSKNQQFLAVKLG